MKNPPAAAFLRQAVFAFWGNPLEYHKTRRLRADRACAFFYEGERKTQAIFIKDGLLVRAAAVQEGFSGTAPEKITR